MVCQNSNIAELYSSPFDAFRSRFPPRKIVTLREVASGRIELVTSHHNLARGGLPPLFSQDRNIAEIKYSEFASNGPPTFPQYGGKLWK